MNLKASAPLRCILLLSDFNLMVGQVGPNLAYLILRIIPSVLYIQYELSNVQGSSLGCLA